jgi:hypothetical protein
MKSLTLFALIAICTTSFAQQKAITETGEDVFLYDDGTWKYAQEKSDAVEEIPTNPATFSKTKNLTFQVKSSNVRVGVWIDPKKWTFKKATNNDAAEYEFQMKGKDVYGMIITERFSIPLTTLRTVALQNGRSVAPDLQIVKEEYRKVNGVTVLLLQMDGTMQGIKVSYYGYYYSDPNGTVQFLTYTSQSLIADMRGECEEFLNGFTLLE